jgi:hypothetical protein
MSNFKGNKGEKHKDTAVSEIFYLRDINTYMRST